MKVLSKKLNVPKHLTTFKRLLNITLILFAGHVVSAQSTNRIGFEYGGMLMPKISSSGGGKSNYSIGVFSETQFNDHWSIGYGIKYLKYGRHTHYQPVGGAPATLQELLVRKDEYSIHNVGLTVVGKFRIKHAAIFVGIQPERALFNSRSNMTTHDVIPIEDIRIENYSQKKLRNHNLSGIAGFEFNQKFGDRLEFYTKPTAQYFFYSFYKDGGFNNIKVAWHINFGVNYILTVYADE